MSEERTSAERRLKEAQNLAISVELLGFCEAQRAFVDSGAGEDLVHRRATQLARESRRRRNEPQSILLAIRIGGGYRSSDLDPSRVDLISRYFATIGSLLTSYFGAESRPAERRMTPRPKRMSEGTLPTEPERDDGPPRPDRRQ